MFRRISVAYNETPESGRALACAIGLAKTLGSELRAVTVVGPPPAITAYADATDPSLTRIIHDDRKETYQQLQAAACKKAKLEGVDLQTHLLEGDAVEAIIRFLASYPTDLLVLGLHRRESYLSRLWSTVYAVAQDAPCSVLGVH